MNDEMLKNLSDMLKDTGSSNDFKNIISNFASNTTNNNDSSNNTDNTNFDFSNIDMATIMKFKGIMSKMSSKKDDPRSNLLLSLKPYLKDSKKNKLDKYMNFMNLTSIIEVFNNIGGDNVQ